MPDDAHGEPEPDPEHQVTPLELFFDLTFVFALTQVTILLADDPTWHGIFRGMLALAALWWAWCVYAWFTSAMDVDEGGIRLLMLAAVGAMFIAALAVPGAFGDDAVLFGVAYFLVRLLHLLLSTIVVRDDPARRSALLRFAPTALLGASLLVVAGFLDGNDRIAVWIVALAIDYLGPAVIGGGHSWRVAPEHFAERYALIVLIALGESLIAIGLGAGFELDAGVIAAAVLGIAVVWALWWLYFDVAAIIARRLLMQAVGLDRHRLALHAYSYLHLPIAAGIVLFALGLKTTVGDVGGTLDTVPAFALCGGAALYLLGHVAFLFRMTRRIFRRRTLGAIVLLALIPLAGAIPALAALALVSAVCAFVVAYEAIRHREHRVQVRHPRDRALRAAILITGMSGTGKSAALAELARRGHRVVDTDHGEWIEDVKLPDGSMEPLWNEERIDELLSGHADGALFVVGTVANQGEFYPRFDAVVLLSTPLDVILERVASRENPFGRTEAEREKIADDLAAYEPLLRAGATAEIDTRRPLAEVVDELESIARQTGT